MANYNSQYTGAEIEAAIEKTESIKESKLVFDAGASPVNTGVLLSSITVNPDTGDNTGVYDVIYSVEGGDVTSASVLPGLSRIFVASVSQSSAGTGHTDMNSTGIYSSSVDLSPTVIDGVPSAAKDGYLFGEASNHIFSSGSSSHTPLYIHRIYRLQNA